MHPAETCPYDEKRKQTQEVFAQLSALHDQLDALDAAIAAKTKKMREYGSLDPDIRRDTGEAVGSRRNPPTSVIVTEIDALGTRLTNWIHRVDERFQRARAAGLVP
jgi:hypothetical protein